MRIEALDLCKAYGTGWIRRRYRPVLEAIDLVVSPGARIGVVGPSGAGKTTLGLMLAGIVRPDRGSLLCNGADLWASAPRERKRLGRKLQMVFQHPESTFDPRWTMARSLKEPFVLSGLTPSETGLRDLLAPVELDPSLLGRRPCELSGGELQRMAIGRALAMAPEVLILDEPTAMLDVLTQARVIRLLENIQKTTGVGTVFISHDPALVTRFCHRVYRLEGGRLEEKSPLPCCINDMEKS